MSPVTASSSRNFNREWDGSDARTLNRIPQTARGICGCRLCPTRTHVVQGRTFVSHMKQLHPRSPIARSSPIVGDKTSSPGALPDSPTTPTQRSLHLSPSRQLMRSGLSTPLAIQPVSLPEVSADIFGLGLTTYDSDATDRDDVDQDGDVVMRDPDDVEEDLPDGNDFAWMAGEEHGGSEPTPLDRDDGQDEADDNDEALTGAIEPEIAPLAPPPGIDEDTSRVVHAPQLQHLDDEDLLKIWPYPIPEYLLRPWWSGNLPNPFASVTSSSSTRSLLSTIIPTLSHALSGTFNVPRRAVELVGRIANLAVDYARRRQHDDIVRVLQEQCPGFQPSMIAHLHPDEQEPFSHHTLTAQLHNLDVDTHMIVHPECPNVSCQTIFYNITDAKGFSQLPVKCPDCSEPLWNDLNKPRVYYYARRSLREELEVVFKVPGLEEAVVNRARRKQARDEEDLQRGYKVYREQDDGDAWAHPTAPDTVDPSDPASPLSLRLNLTLDWANPNSFRNSPTASMGPISLQIANLPSRLRASPACMLVVGMTPGPKEPRASNCWKFLLPLALEIRMGSEHGLWIRTPRFPQGRLVKVELSCICADRPAACALTGGPHFASNAGPCLRCTIHKKDIGDTTPQPNRDSRAHGRAIIKQIIELPRVMREAEQEWAREMDEWVAGNRRRKWKPMTKTKRNEIEAEVFQVDGNISAFDLLPGFDKFPATAFDPMHNVLEGAVKTYVFRVLIVGAHGISASAPANASEAGGSLTSIAASESSVTVTEGIIEEGMRMILAEEKNPGADKTKLKALKQHLQRLKKLPSGNKPPILSVGDLGRLQELIPSGTIPSSATRLNAHFGDPSGGSPSADAWRSLGDVYGPILLPLIWAERGSGVEGGNKLLIPAELDTLLLLFEICSLALRSVITQGQLDRLETLIDTWRTKAYALHPSLKASTNLHSLSHLAEDIRRHGPVYNWWCFPSERLNKLLKSINRSGGSEHQAQVVTYRGCLKMRDVESTRRRVMKEVEVEGELERDTVRELDTVYDQYIRSNTTNHVSNSAVRYAELDREAVEGMSTFSAGSAPIQIPLRRPMTLDLVLLELLRRCFERLGLKVNRMRSTLKADEFFLPSSASLVPRIKFDAITVESAETTGAMTEPVPGSTFDLRSYRNSLVEIRDRRHDEEGLDKRCSTFLVSQIFEHQHVLGNGQESKPRLYAVIRRLVRYQGDLFFDWRQYPELDIWAWKANVLGPKEVIYLHPLDMGRLRPVTLFPMASQPTDLANSHPVWVTRPLYRH